MRGLSKSRLIEWRQCSKRLWLKVHRPDLIEKSDESERAFQVGYAVGEVARELFPGGMLVDTDDLREALNLTRQLLATQPGVPLFEATFERDGVLVRADLLLPAPDGYRMVEVKSATSVKDYYLEDAAIQRWVVGDAITLAGVEIAHIDNSFVYPGRGDYRGLLKHVPVDAETESIVPDVPSWIDGARHSLSGAEPSIEPGDQCADPFECPFQAYCNASLHVTDFPLDGLPRLSAGKREQLEALGITDVRQIPDDFPLTDGQARVRRIVLAGEPELLPEAAQVLSALPYPRYYLDFETVNMAVPIWAGTHPYQQVPVQWSCHVETEPGRIEHSAHLADGNGDPREAFASSMIEVLGSQDPVLVYNQSFELGRIRELARDLPHLASSLLAIADRVVDLYPITCGAYYHPDMHGSWSIKSVLPTIAPDLSYGAMEVGDGAAAADAWLEILHPDTPDEHRQLLRTSLADYCALDTLAMVRLAWFLGRTPLSSFEHSPHTDML